MKRRKDGISIDEIVKQFGLLFSRLEHEPDFARSLPAENVTLILDGVATLIAVMCVVLEAPGGLQTLNHCTRPQLEVLARFGSPAVQAACRRLLAVPVEPDTTH
jgi:hypothetical protein